MLEQRVDALGGGAMPTAESIEASALNSRAKVVSPNSAQATPVIKLAEELGYTVTEFSPSPKTDSISGAVDHDSRTIYVNKTEGPARKRFTIAHEIGHILLHGSEANEIDYRQHIGYSPSLDIKEQDANLFAAALLMPRNVFESLWYAYGGEIDRIADFLQVSRQSAKVRASVLGLSKDD